MAAGVAFATPSFFTETGKPFFGCAGDPDFLIDVAEFELLLFDADGALFPFADLEASEDFCFFSRGPSTGTSVLTRIVGLVEGPAGACFTDEETPPLLLDVAVLLGFCAELC